MKKIFVGILLLMQLNSNNLFAQNNSASFEDGVIDLSKYIASDDFIDFSQLNNDQELVNHLYKRAIKYYNGNISEALLALTFATLPFNKMPITIPVIDYKVNLNLPSVDEDLFNLKKKNLPGIIYFDSPINGGQDKDKVAHFFGNAFLSYNISLINVSKVLGILVELFESSFKVSGGVDFRDLQTNGLGELFGDSLRRNPELLPSEVFKVYSLFNFSYN